MKSDCFVVFMLYALRALHFLLGAVIGVVRGVAGGEGSRLLGLFRMLGYVLVEVSQAQTVDIVGERCEATAERERDV